MKPLQAQLASLLVLLASNHAYASNAEFSKYDLGCYSSTGSLTDQGENTYMVIPDCLKQCDNLGLRYAALNNGNMCWCGDEKIDESDKVSDDKCDVPCAGWPANTCGGKDTWNLYDTGYVATHGLSNDHNESSSTSSGVSTAGGTVTASASTSAVTTSSSDTPTSTSSDSMGTSSSASITPTPSTSNANRRYSFLW